MATKLISKSEFSRRAGVHRSSVTRYCRSELLPAMHGDRIDMLHPAAIKILTEKAAPDQPAAVSGADSLYDAAILLCRASGKWTPNSIRKPLEIGSKRAATIISQMKAAGVIPNAIPAKPFVVITPAIKAQNPATAPTPHIRGTAAVNAAKQSDALAALAQDINEGDTVHEIPDDILAFVDMTLRELIQRFGTNIAFADWLSAVKKIEDINEKRLKNAATKGELVSRGLVKLGIIDPIEAAHIKLLTDGSKTIARRVTAMHDSGRPLEDLEKFVKDQITSFIRPIKAKVARTLRDA